MKNTTKLIKPCILRSNQEYKSNLPMQSWGADFSCSQLVQLLTEMRRDRIDREYIWDTETAFSFIESILLGIPLRGLYFIIFNNKQLIVDGYQRIGTLHYYVDHFLDHSLQLSFKNCQDNFFPELSGEEIEKLANVSLPGIVVKTNDLLIVREIFHRIRKGEQHFTSSHIESYIENILS